MPSKKPQSPVSDRLSASLFYLAAGATIAVGFTAWLTLNGNAPRELYLLSLAVMVIAWVSAVQALAFLGWTRYHEQQQKRQASQQKRQTRHIDDHNDDVRREIMIALDEVERRLTAKICEFAFPTVVEPRSAGQRGPRTIRSVEAQD